MDGILELDESGFTHDEAIDFADSILRKTPSYNSWWNLKNADEALWVAGEILSVIRTQASHRSNCELSKPCSIKVFKLARRMIDDYQKICAAVVEEIEREHPEYWDQQNN